LTDVFISYSNPDRTKAELLAKQLAAAGMSVWWDGELSGGESFDVESKRRRRKLSWSFGLRIRFDLRGFLLRRIWRAGSIDWFRLSSIPWRYRSVSPPYKLPT
jgi:hypothetical protein